MWYAWKKRIRSSIFLLAITRPTKRMFVHSSSNWLATKPLGAPIEVREARNDRQHGGAGKSERLEILPVELRIAQREIAAIDVGLELAPSAETLARERAMDADEIFGRRDVVIDERHPIGQRKRGTRCLGPEREMVQQQVVGMARVDELAVIARQRLEPAVGRLDENLGLVAGAAKHPLNPEHLVADRVAVAERGQHLVDAGSRSALRARRPPAPPRAAAPAGGRVRRTGAGRRSAAAATTSRSARQRGDA